MALANLIVFFIQRLAVNCIYSHIPDCELLISFQISKRTMTSIEKS